jgi:Leucine-rich repeat (LRR) protein
MLCEREVLSEAARSAASHRSPRCAPYARASNPNPGQPVWVRGCGTDQPMVARLSNADRHLNLSLRMYEHEVNVNTLTNLTFLDLSGNPLDAGDFVAL